MSNSQETVRFAYVGCGFVAQTIHIPNFRSLPDCRFMALAELRSDLGKSVAARFGIPKVYRSHLEIAADPDIEAVGVSAAYAIQAQIAEDLVRAGKHVFMEKPMATSVAKARSIVDAAAASDRLLCVGYMKRYDPGNVQVRDIVGAWRSSGRAGKLLYARNHGFCGDWIYGRDPSVIFEASNDPMPAAVDEYPEWLPDVWRGRYLSYLQQYTHNINLLRFLLEDARGGATVRSVDFDDDGFTGLVTLDIGGVRSVVESAATNFHAWEEHTQIYFENGWVRTEAPPLMLKETPATVETYLRDRDLGGTPRRTQFYPQAAWAYREEAKHFLACVRGLERPRSSASDTLSDVQLMEDIYRKFLTSRGAV